MQVTKISNQTYCSQNVRNQNIKNNQQNLSFGMTFIPNELAPRFEKLVRGCNITSLEGLIKEKYFGVGKAKVFVDDFEKTELLNIAFSALDHKANGLEVFSEGLQKLLPGNYNQKAWTNADIEKLEEGMKNIAPDNVQAKFDLLYNNGFRFLGINKMKQG